MDWKYIVENVQFTNFWAALWGPLLLIALDFGTGYLGACLRHERDSAKMREGGGHKAAEVACILAALIVDGSLILPTKLVYIVSGYIMLMEIVSIWENVKKMFGKKKVPAVVDHTLGHIADELFDDSVLDIEHSASEDACESK